MRQLYNTTNFNLKENFFKGGFMTTIIGVKLENRQECSVEFQELLTKYGCGIRTRLGLHKVVENRCLSEGIILLEVLDNADVLYGELIKRWECKKMCFD